MIDNQPLSKYKIQEVVDEFDKEHKTTTKLLFNLVTMHRYFKMSKNGIHITREIRNVCDVLDCINELRRVHNFLQQEGNE